VKVIILWKGNSVIMWSVFLLVLSCLNCLWCRNSMPEPVRLWVIHCESQGLLGSVFMSSLVCLATYIQYTQTSWIIRHSAW